MSRRLLCTRSKMFSVRKAKPEHIIWIEKQTAPERVSGAVFEVMHKTVVVHEKQKGYQIDLTVKKEPASLCSGIHDCRGMNVHAAESAIPDVTDRGEDHFPDRFNSFMQNMHKKEQNT